MKIIAIAFLVTFSFNAYSEDTAFLVMNPCLNRDLEKIETSHESIDICQVSSASRLLTSADFKRHLMQGNGELAIKNWLSSSSPLFSNLRPEDIGVRAFQNAGNNMLAMFEVYLFSKPESLYILKLTWTTRDLGQLKLLQQAQNSIIAHPECWIKDDIRPPVVPKLPWIYDVAVIPWIHDPHFSEPGDPDLLLVLMEKLPGITLAKNNAGDNFLADRIAGQGVGYFHAAFVKNPEVPYESWQTFTHSDLHVHNLLVDGETRSVGLVDGYFRIGNAKDELVSYASSQIGVFFDQCMGLLFDKGCSTFIDMLRDLAIENHKEFTEITSLLEDRVFQDKIRLSQTFQTADRIFKHFRAFILGYIEAMPFARRAEVKVFLEGLCSKMFRSLVELIQKENGGCIEQLSDAIRQVIPPRFFESLELSDGDGTSLE